MFDPVDFPAGVYADVRFERITTTSIRIRDRQLEDAAVRTVTGAFMRVLRRGRWLYGSTTDLGSIPARLADLARSDALRPVTAAHDVAERLIPHRADVRRFSDSPVSAVPLRDKIAVLERRFPLLDRPTIRSWSAIYTDLHSVRRFVSSRGADVIRDNQSAGYAIRIALAEGERSFSDLHARSAETFQGLDPENDGLERLLDDAETFLRHAEPIEPGHRPVVLSPAVAGVFAHESFGHKSEADFMLGDPSMLEEWHLGKQVGSDILSIVDDGSLPGTGYTPFDDEGQPAQRTSLVRNGILSGRLHSTGTAAAFGEELSGNARAMDFTFEPIVRMTSTFIEAGTSTRDELFAGIDDGFFIQSFRHGSGMSTFTIAPSLAWRIRGGKLAEPARLAVITGSVFETLGLIDGLSNEVGMWPTVTGGCGKMEQYPLPVAFGGPYVRISRMMCA